jgi:hypothetical protein
MDGLTQLMHSAISYTGEEVFSAQEITWAGFSSINAKDVSEGSVRNALMSPHRGRRSIGSKEEIPRTPKLGGSDREANKVAVHMVEAGILCPTELKDLATFRGRPILGGWFGIQKSSQDPVTGKLRFVMNILPSNWLQTTIEGDMSKVPLAGRWQHIILSIWRNPFPVGPPRTVLHAAATFRDYMLAQPEPLAQLSALTGGFPSCHCPAGSSCRNDAVIDLRYAQVHGLGKRVKEVCDAQFALALLVLRRLTRDCQSLV